MMLHCCCNMPEPERFKVLYATPTKHHSSINLDPNIYAPTVHTWLKYTVELNETFPFHGYVGSAPFYFYIEKGLSAYFIYWMEAYCQQLYNNTISHSRGGIKPLTGWANTNSSPGHLFFHNYDSDLEVKEQFDTPLLLNCDIDVEGDIVRTGLSYRNPAGTMLNCQRSILHYSIHASAPTRFYSEFPSLDAIIEPFTQDYSSTHVKTFENWELFGELNWANYTGVMYWARGRVQYTRLGFSGSDFTRQIWLGGLPQPFSQQNLPFTFGNTGFTVSWPIFLYNGFAPIQLPVTANISFLFQQVDLP